MNILILSLEYGPEISGGVGTHAQELTRGLGTAGHRVVTLAYTLGEERVIIEGTVSVYLLPLANVARTPDTSPIVGSILNSNRGLVEKALQLINNAFRPDIIQFYNWLTLNAAVELKRVCRCPIVSTIQYLSEPVERWWGQTPGADLIQHEKALAHQADHFIAVSQSMANILGATHPVARSRISVVYNAMDPLAFVGQPITQEMRGKIRSKLSAEARKIIIFAGRLHPQKGIESLFDMAEWLFAKRDDVLLIIAGDADSAEYARYVRHRLESSQQLKKQVRMLGKLPRRQLSLLYQASDVAIVPSIYEPFGYAAIEAMSAAVPTIATNVGGLAEIIQNGRTGLLVPVHQDSAGRHCVDTETMGFHCAKLLDEETFAKRLGLSGRDRVCSVFDDKHMVSATLQVYREALTRYGLENN